MILRRLPVITFLVLLAGSISAGCKDAGPDGAPHDAPPATQGLQQKNDLTHGQQHVVSAREIIDAGLNPRPDRQIGELLDRMPPPIDVQVQDIQNRHVPDQTDTIRTYAFDAYTVEIYRVSADARLILTRLRIDEPGREHGLSFDVGAPVDTVQAHLGSPERATNDRYRYPAGIDDSDRPPAAPHYLDIVISDGVVQALEWHFYYD